MPFCPSFWPYPTHDVIWSQITMDDLLLLHRLQQLGECRVLYADLNISMCLDVGLQGCPTSRRLEIFHDNGGWCGRHTSRAVQQRCKAYVSKGTLDSLTVPVRMHEPDK